MHAACSFTKGVAIKTTTTVQVTILIAPNVSGFLVGMSGARLDHLRRTLFQNGVSACINLFNILDVIQQQSTKKHYAHTLVDLLTPVVDGHTTPTFDGGSYSTTTSVSQYRMLNIQAQNVQQLLSVLSIMFTMFNNVNHMYYPPVAYFYPTTVQYLVPQSKHSQVLHLLTTYKTYFPHVEIDTGHSDLITDRVKHKQHDKIILFLCRNKDCSNTEWSKVKQEIQVTLSGQRYEHDIMQHGMVTAIPYKYVEMNATTTDTTVTATTMQMSMLKQTPVRNCFQFMEESQTKLMPILQLGGDSNTCCNNVSFMVCAHDPVVLQKHADQSKQFNASTMCDGDNPYAACNITGFTFVVFAQAAQQVWSHVEFQLELSLISNSFPNTIVQLQNPLFPDNHNVQSLLQPISIFAENMDIALMVFQAVFSAFQRVALRVLHLNKYDVMLYKRHFNQQMPSV